MDPKIAAMTEASSFVAKLNAVFLFPLIYLLSSVAFLVFIYGCAMYIINADSDTAREEGKKNITFGLIGLVVMASAYAILAIGAGTFGLNKQLDCATDPRGAGCSEAYKIPERNVNTGG